MTSKTRPTVINCVTYGILATTVIGCFMMPESVIAFPDPPPPETLELLGTVRDFRQSHPDFDVMPAHGLGHVAGNVSRGLSADQRPIFNIGGDEHGPFENRVAHWKFDDGAGVVARDEIGANHGSVVNGATWTSGRDGGALHFDGNDDFVNVPNSPDMQITGDITLTGWFKLDEAFHPSYPDTMVIMEKFLDTEHDFHIGFAGTDYNRVEVPKGTMVFKVENGPTSDYYCYVWTKQKNWAPDVWYHFACALDSTNTANNKIFINGVDDTDSTIAAGVGFLDTAYDAPMRIGGKTIDYNGLATDIYFKGAVDDVMIFDRALTGGDFVHVPGGFEVSSQWYSKSGYKLAPHLYSDPMGDREILLGSFPVVNGGAVLDGFDSSVGPYGAPNVLPAPPVVTSADVPPITVPTGLPWQALFERVGNSTSVLATDVHCDTFSIRNQHILQISGNVRVVVDVNLEILNNVIIELLPGARLEIYSQGTLLMKNNIDLNIAGDPRGVRIFHVSTSPVELDNSVAVASYIVAPNAVLDMKNTADLFGRFQGAGMTLLNPAGYHHDVRTIIERDVCNAPILDVLGSGGVRSDAAISSADSFDHWFRNVLGQNLGGKHTLTLTRVNGVWEYLDDDFHPIDGRMLGNEGMAHNHFLTFSTQTWFTFNACASQFIEFAGGDGAWIFINGELVIDLGGVMSGHEQRIELDRLGLVDGEMYDMHLFYAQRHPMSSKLYLRTNIDLAEPLGPIAVTGSFD